MSNIFQILSCSSNAQNCCSDYALVGFLNIIIKALKTMQIIVPIILLVMLSVQLVKLVINPNEKKNVNGLKNEIIGIVIFFMLPYIVNLVFGLVPDSIEMSDCWKIAQNTKAVMDKYKSSPDTDVDEDFIYKTKSSKKKTTKKKKVSKKSLKKINSLKKNKRLKKKYYKLGKIKGTKNGIKLVTYARGYVGNRYCFGGTNPNVCADCSGFVQYVFKHFGVNLPRTASGQYQATNMYTRVSPKNIRAGDIAFYSNPPHVAIFTGNGEEVVHASSPTTGIKISPTYKFNSNTFLCIGRIKKLK